MIDIGLIVGGLIAGLINAMAGGGSTVTLPLLLLFGVDAGVANGTNRVAVLFQSLSASRSFAVHGAVDWRITWRLLPLVLGGALLGAVAATRISPVHLETIFGLMFIVLGLMFLIQSKFKMSDYFEGVARFRWVFLLLVGFYGGLLQAGVGIPLLMTLLGSYGLSFGAANATKAIHIAIYSLAVLFIFGSADQVHFRYGLELACGGVIGSHFGAKIAMRHQPRWLTPVLSTFLMVMGFRTLM